MLDRIGLDGVLYGQRALLMQAMHPVAFEGLIGTTKGLDSSSRPFVRITSRYAAWSCLLRRVMPSNPSRPVPTRSRLAGSGTAVTASPPPLKP